MADFDTGKIYLELLGSPQVYYNGTPVQVTRKRVRALLFYLAAQQKPVARSRLADVLWPDRDSVSASKNLSIHISYLKSDLGSKIIKTEADYISINPDVSSDLQRFDTLAAEEDADSLLKALSLFRGSFLDGFTLQDAQPFEQWSIEMESYWNNRFMETSITAAKLLSQSKRYDNALAVLDAAYKIDPLQESLCRQRMQILSMSGNRSSVSRVYYELVSLLNSELGVPPAPDTAACYQQIISSDEKPITQPDTTAHDKLYSNQETIFVGRQTVLKDLLQGKGGHFILLQGKSGLGKTRLMNEYIKQSGLFSIALSFRQQEQDIPYFAVIKCIRCMTQAKDWNNTSARIMQQIHADRWRVLCQLIPELNSSAGYLSPDFVISTQQIFESFEQFFSCLIEGRPAVISIDDIHFADNSSLELLHYLVSHVSFKNVQFIATYRPSLARPRILAFFNAMQRESFLQGIEIGKLDNESMLKLLLYYYPEIGGDKANRLISLADGNPYWMKTIIYGLDSGFTEFSGKSSLGNLFKIALRSLSSQALDAIYALSVFGESCDAVLFQAICKNLQPKKPENIFMELFSANLISRDYDDNIAFAHSKIYEYVFSCVSTMPKKVRALHLLIAEAMESVYGNNMISHWSITLADHYKQSECPKKCGNFAYMAGSYLMTLDNRKQANDYYKLAYSYLEPPAKLDVVFVMYDNMILLGQNYEAKIYVQSAIKTAADGGYRDYVLAFRALQKLSVSPEYLELLQNIIPSYTLSCDKEIVKMLLEAKKHIDTDLANPLLRNYILRLLSAYYRIVGDYDNAAKCLWQIIGSNIVLSENHDIINSMLAYSSILDVTSILNMDSDPQIAEVFSLEEQIFNGGQVQGFLCSNIGMRALLMNIQGNTEDGILLMNSAISEARRSGNKFALASYLATQAMLVHNAHPEKSYSMNFEAYTLAKEINARYTLVRALTGLVITCSTLSEAERFYSELHQLISQLGSGTVCAKLETAKKALDAKREHC